MNKGKDAGHEEEENEDDEEESGAARSERVAPVQIDSCQIPPHDILNHQVTKEHAEAEEQN